jgi:DNA-binding NarL/FixJ family response regulator
MTPKKAVRKESPAKASPKAPATPAAPAPLPAAPVEQDIAADVPASASATPRTQQAAQSGQKLRVLIVDDHPIVREGLAQMIDRQPDLMVCAMVDGVREAMSAIRDAAPNIAIVDLTLKDLGGLELVKMIAAAFPELPSLVLSMHDEKLYAERALRAGARGYIMKQEGTAKLMTALRVVLNGEIYLSEKMAARVLGKLVRGRVEADGSPLNTLSDRELEVFELIGRGFGTRQIAERLCVSIKTVESHREHIKQKLKLRNATELVQHATQWATQEGAI